MGLPPGKAALYLGLLVVFRWMKIKEAETQIKSNRASRLSFVLSWLKVTLFDAAGTLCDHTRVSMHVWTYEGVWPARGENSHKVTWRGLWRKFCFGVIFGLILSSTCRSPGVCHPADRCLLDGNLVRFRTCHLCVWNQNWTSSQGYSGKCSGYQT